MTEGDDRRKHLIESAVSERRLTATAHTFLKRWPSYSHPVLLACDDGNEYVVKGQHAGRAIVSDQVLGRLGVALAAPVGQVCLVEIPAELVAAEPEMSGVQPGTAHACRWIPGCSERAHIAHTELPENKPRFAALALLYGWAYASDHQFIYANDPPHLVYSVDHGHFFPGGPDWTIESLADAPRAVPDAIVVSQASLSNADLVGAAEILQSIPDEQIAKAVASPPDEWSLAFSERVALAAYLGSRRDDLVSALLGGT